MTIPMLLLANGVFLTVILLVLLLVSTNGRGRKGKRTNIKEDIKKIKEQVVDSQD